MRNSTTNVMVQSLGQLCVLGRDCSNGQRWQSCRIAPGFRCAQDLLLLYLKLTSEPAWMKVGISAL